MSKEVQHALRWYNMLVKARTSTTAASTIKGYTNFTLNHVWEKFDCQHQLLQREALVPIMKWNPEVLSVHPESIYYDTCKPSGKIVS
jgi:hypothetical protein